MNYFAVSALINLIAGLTGIILVAAVKKKNWRDENKVFIGFCLTAVIWSFGYLMWQMAIESSSALFWVRASKAGAILIPILYLHWILSLALKIDKKKKVRILKFGYTLTLFFLLFSFSPLFIKEVKAVNQFPFWPQPGPLYHFYLIFSYVGLVGYGLIQMIKEYKYLISEPDYLKSYQRISKIWLIIAGTIIGFGGGATNFFLFYNIPIAPYLNILAGAGILLMALGIRKYTYVHIHEEPIWEKMERLYLNYRYKEEKEEFEDEEELIESLHFSPKKL